MQQEKKFKYWQWRVIICSMITYAMFYFVRKNFSFALPSLNAEYGIGNTAFGIIMTIGGLVYGLSKFANGILADRLNARWHLVIGLSICTLTSVLFGFVDKMSYIFIAVAALYIINQIFQGCGFSPCNRLMVNWVPPKELATKMSIWNTSHSIGAGIVSVICGVILGNMGTNMAAEPDVVGNIFSNLVSGLDPNDSNYVEKLEKAQELAPNFAAHVGAWKWCFWIPACIAAAGILFTIVTLRDTPKSVGLPELPKVKGEIDDKENEDPKAFRRFLMERVFKNPVIWVLAITDLFVYIVRFAILDWGPSMLSDMGLSQELTGWTVAIFEVAGCAGMLCAGYISDKFFKSKSQRVCAIEMGLVAACLIALHYLQDAGQPIIFLILLALAGFLIYGPQALLGVTAANIATKKAASSAVGLIGLMSYLSTIVTGVGFGYLADKFGGWGWIFITMGGLSTVGAVLIMSIWGIKEGSGE